MILYHISTELDHNGYFQPDIPECLKYSDDDFLEDISILRVCASSTIEGCFSSIPDGGRNFEKLNFNQNGFFKLFILDTEKLGIQDDQIIDGENLYNRGLVYDAHLTGEHWILDSFQVPEEDTLIISPYFWKSDAVELIRLPFLEKRGYKGSESETDTIHLIRHLRFFADNGKSHLNIYPGPEISRSLLEDVVIGEWVNYRENLVESLQKVKLTYYLSSKVKESVFA